MSKKSDDSIERIFRQALTQYDTTFRESDWLKMEKMLKEEADRRAAIRSKRIKGTAYTLTGLTGLIIAVYFLAFNGPSDSIARLNNSVGEMQASDDLKENGDVKHESLSDGLLSEKSGVVDSIKHKEATDKAEPEESLRYSTPIPAGKGTENIVGEKEATTPIDNPGISSSIENIDRTKDPAFRNAPKSLDPKIKQNLQRDQPLSDREVVGNASAVQPSDMGLATQEQRLNKAYELENDIRPTSDAQKIEAGNAKSNDLNGINISDSTQEKSAVIKNGDLKSEMPLNKVPALASQKDSISIGEMVLAHKTDSLHAGSSEDPEKGQKSRPEYRWSAGVVFAPEFSTTSMKSYSTPGESVGLRIGYKISNRFTINTGIIRSMKKYTDEGSAYSPRNPAYWQIRTNGVVPEEIDGKCLVYELPLDVQFDAIQTQKSRLFFSTGISSYFMKNQTYDYTFESPNPGADTGWKSQESETYWLSVAMVSAGYERYIHRSFAIGIEPYLKVSLSEIGWPNVKLFSTGAYVTLRYKFTGKTN